ncbi:hypothetical protein QR680_013496 [Steinernema hermaphroditum]|uniref:G-protein coupled receptors family 1 profile domain-containing protein n=1 Tax=Steinernema hermaphroditum TaxID=289476 RepID=A0AA39I7A1_9BILA|nr:hypothetical protein QR680_013496 [Steinernema hermaphroditum]
MPMAQAIATHPAFVAVKSAISLFAIVGNTFIIFTIFRCPKLRNEKFNLLIFLLAFGDIVIGKFSRETLMNEDTVGVNAPFAIWLDHLATSPELTLALRVVLIVSQSSITFGDHVTQIAMLLIAADRMYVIFRLQKLGMSNLYRLYLLSIPVTLLIALIPVALAIAGSSALNEGGGSSSFGSFMTFSAVFFNVTIIGSYLIIAIKYRYQIKQSFLTRSSQVSFNRIVLGIVVVYFLAWCIPKWASSIVANADVDVEVKYVFALVPQETVLLSSALNVFVYGYMHRDLRNAMKSYFNATVNVEVLHVSVHSSSRRATNNH